MYFGIDLGTTNSSITYWVKTGDTFDVKTIKNSYGLPLTPSVVSFDEDTHKPIVGKTAFDNFDYSPNRTIRWVKREMGGQKIYEIDGRAYSPQIISAHILKDLKIRAEKDLQMWPEEEINEIVITVPADFDINAKQATIDAAKIAGFKEIALIAEPNAAILNYIFRTQGNGKLEDKFGGNNYYVVFDLGGGTFDVSLSSIELDKDGVPHTSVISSSGDKYLGGLNFDIDLMKHILTKAKIIYKNDVDTIDTLIDNVDKYFDNTQIIEEGIRDTLARLIKECENGKIALTEDSRRYFTFMTYNGRTFRIEINREEFEAIMKPYFKRIKDHIDKVLSEAKLSTQGQINSWQDVEGVLLVGGSTNIPSVRELCLEIFQKEPIDGIDTFESVAKGAAIYSAKRKSTNSFLGDFTIVVPHEFGIVRNGDFHSVLQRGSKKKSNIFNYTVPFSLDIKSPITIAQIYHDEQGAEIILDIEKINYSHPFMYTGDILDITLSIDDNSMLSVEVKENCIEDTLEVFVDYSSKLSDAQINEAQEQLNGDSAND